MLHLMRNLKFLKKKNLIKPYFSTKNSSGLGLPLIDKIISDNNGSLKIKTNNYSGFKVEIKLNV